MRMKSKLTERERKWIKAYFGAQGNATEATRQVYGGTPGACRVKGHKKKRKFNLILQEIEAGRFYKMEYNGMTGIDFYLGNLETEANEQKTFTLSRTKGLKKFLKLVYMY
jgi:hypothetical protein